MIKHGLVNAARSKFSSPDFIAPSEALKQVLKKYAASVSIIIVF